MLDPLIHSLGEDKKEGFSPEIIVVTGDVANSGLKKEYDQAAVFFDKLLKSLDLPKDRLFIVPGNHDVDLTRYNPSENIPVYKSMDLLNSELEKKKYRNALLKGMNPYFNFIKRYCPHLKSENEKLVPFVHRYRSTSGKHIGLVGLNSAWMCRKCLPDQRKIAIGEYQIQKAMAELTEQGEVDLTITLFHHPLQWLWEEDAQRLDIYLKDAMVLNGHCHIPGGGFHNGYGSSRYAFLAGAAYMGSASRLPARFQYITCDWQKDEIRLDFRKMADGKPLWVVDTDTTRGGVKVYSHVWNENRGKDSSSEKPSGSAR